MKKFISQEDMRIANLFEVLSIIRRETDITRKGIQDRTGMSWGGVSQIVSRLLELTYCLERKSTLPTSQSGRTPFMLDVNTSDHYTIGIDINLSGLHAVVINLKDETVYEKSRKANPTNPELFLKEVYALIDEVKAKFSYSHFLTIGVSMQGKVDNKTGISKWLNLPGWKDVPIQALLEEKYALPVCVAHDPDCLAFAATRESSEEAILIRVLHGLGMAVMKNERLISGTGMLEVGEVLVSDENGALVKLKQCLMRETPESFAKAMAYVLCNAAILFDIQHVLLCGAYVEENALVERISKHLNQMAPFPCEVAFFDHKKASYGAALMALEKHLRYMR